MISGTEGVRRARSTRKTAPNASAGTAAAGATDRLGLDQWIDAAMRALISGGVAAVRVEPLAVELGVTKGSFYWHFANRAALLQAVRAAWQTRATEAIVAEVERGGGDARERLARLLGLVARRNAGLERAMRTWAAHDDATAEVVTSVDFQRVTYLVALFSAMNLSGPQAEARARLCYHAFIGQMSVADARTDAQRLAEWQEIVLPMVARAPE